MWERSSYYRRKGPGRLSVLARALDDAGGAAQRQLTSHARPLRAAAAAAIPVIVGLTIWRKKLGMHPAATLIVACGTPLAAAVALPPGRPRYAAIAAGYMYLFKLSWELPYDDPERLLIDEPIRFDTWIGRGVPPGLRLQRALRRPAR